MPSVREPQSLCRFGIARCDITPPVGIYHRMWGAAAHDRSTGVHRPLTATAMVFQSIRTRTHAAKDNEQIVVAVDHVTLWAKEMEQVLDIVSAGTGVPKERLTVAFSHTHAAGLMGYERVELPGGDLIPEYLHTLAERIAGIVRQALAELQSVNITYTTGRCSLAAHRDFWDDECQQFVCGFNPDGLTDDAVLIARVTRADGEPLAAIVNYACHPTTLAWENTLISPDYPGALREVVEKATGTTCVFLQGASGDLGPREGYVGDVEVAERNGRQLGYAVLSAWEALPPPQTTYNYAGPVISGATLGTWKYQSVPDVDLNRLQEWRLQRWTVDLPYRSDLSTVEATREEQLRWSKKEQQALAAGDQQTARDCRAMVERMERRLTKLEVLPPGPSFPFPVVLWRMGDALWLAVEGELYHWFQKTLRAHFPSAPIVLITLTNGYRCGYLPTADVYGKGIYQESVAFLAAGALEQLAEAIRRQVQILLNLPAP